MFPYINVTRGGGTHATLSTDTLSTRRLVLACEVLRSCQCLPSSLHA